MLVAADNKTGVVSATGDTGSPQPFPLGMPFDRVQSVVAERAQAIIDWIEPAPTAPSYPIAIPGTLVPKSPPLLATQGDSRDARLSPLGWLTTAQNAARGRRTPTTHPTSRARAAIATLRERFTPYSTG